MTRRGWICAALVLAACSAKVKEGDQPIKLLSKQSAPSPEKLPIDVSQPVQISPQAAQENYRKILELAPDSDTKIEAMRRVADLQVQLDESGGGGDPKKSEQLQRDAIKLYTELLATRPDDKNNDRVLYELSRAYQNVGEEDKAVDALGQLNKKFPESPLASDAHFRRAELLFRLNRYDESSAEYKSVMNQGGKTPFFESAQYKYGWSLYKQAQYEQSIEVFCAILDRELPTGVGISPEAAVKAVAQSKRDLAKDALRVTGLAFAALGGGDSINDYIGKHGEPRFSPLLYNALGEQLIEKERYSDAAKAYGAFTTRYPNSPLAPSFQTKVIATYQRGGFSDVVVQEKERFATAYDPAAPYWSGKPPSPEVMTELRGHLDDLAKFYHARAQKNPQQNKADFLTAASWYQRTLKAFPKDPKNQETNFLLAESLLDGGKTTDAAAEFVHTAYDYPANPRSADAAYSAVSTYERNAKEVSAAERPAALQQAVASSKKLADTFPNHPQLLALETRAALDLFELKSLDDAIAMANRVLKAQPPAPPDLQRQAVSVTADAQFAQKRYADAEVAYTQMLQLTPPSDTTRKQVVEQLAASIYKQGEAARDAKDLRGAVAAFTRVGKVVPDASIRATADYDAAAALITLEDWTTAAQVLENFRSNFPQSSLLPDADKKLAVVYQKANRPHEAAAAFGRIAARPGESADVRRESAWQAATLFDQSKDSAAAATAYEAYVKAFPQPLERSLDARVRLAEIYKSRGDQTAYLRIQRDFVSADAAAGGERNDKSKILAARASLELGRGDAAAAAALPLSAPLQKSLPAKKAATERAIATLSRAAGYGISDVTTAATYELGSLYQGFARSMLDSERPRKLSGLELEQYNLLLEEQAFPFEEKAIQTYEVNLKRIPQGVYDEWVRKSQLALVGLAPGRYSKREQGDEVYEALK